MVLAQHLLQELLIGECGVAVRDGVVRGPTEQVGSLGAGSVSSEKWRWMWCKWCFSGGHGDAVVCVYIKREMNCCCGEEKKIHESVLSPDTHTIRNIKRVEKTSTSKLFGSDVMKGRVT